MASSVVLPQGTYPIGTRSLGPANVPQGITKFRLELDGTQMTDPALKVTIVVDLSLDGGVTWASTSRGPAYDPYPGVLTLEGGTTNRLGQPLAVYPIGADVQQPTNPNRQIRATVIISGTPLTTKGTLTLS